MCGIAGIYYFDSSKHVNPDHLAKMCDKIIHRGPDDEGFYNRANIGLGMRRLSIIDLAGGHQPIFNEDGSKVIVFNGEVYNFIDLRPMLQQRGHQLKTRTDTEVVLHLYEENGIDFLDQLNGMFGLAIWDDRQKELIIARDRIGIKPLYYYQDSEKLIFASEIKSILALPFIKAELDLEGLSSFLKYGFTPAPFTLFQNIKKIPPAHYLRVKNNHISLSAYWRLSYKQKFDLSEDDIATQLYELLKSAVKYQLISDVPLGAFLSGGMDSSGIVHLMSEIGGNGINTYSIGFGKGYEFYNELDTAGRFAVDYHTNHHEILVKPDVVELFPRLIEYLDEPIADSSFIVTNLVSKLASETVKVILSGVGGDELFGGYRRYLNVEMNRYLKVIPFWFRKHFLTIVNKFPIDRNNTLLNYFRLGKAYLNTMELPLHQQYGRYTSIFQDDFREELICKKANTFDFYKSYFDECDSDELLDKLMYFDLKTSLPEQLLLLTDKMSMAESLEARVPFLDHRLVEFAARIPTKMKLNGFKLRYIQKKAFKSQLPSYVIHKKKKGFGAPVGTWIRNELHDMTFDLLSESSIRKQGIFSFQSIQKILNDHFEMKEDYTDHLLELICFQIWYQKYLQ